MQIVTCRKHAHFFSSFRCSTHFHFWSSSNTLKHTRYVFTFKRYHVRMRERKKERDKQNTKATKHCKANKNFEPFNAMCPRKPRKVTIFLIKQLKRLFDGWDLNCFAFGFENVYGNCRFLVNCVKELISFIISKSIWLHFYAIPNNNRIYAIFKPRYRYQLNYFLSVISSNDLFAPLAFVALDFEEIQNEFKFLSIFITNHVLVIFIYFQTYSWIILLSVSLRNFFIKSDVV